jgi:hypothetical protein
MEDESAQANDTLATGGGEAEEGRFKAKVDLQQLADKVYRLMMDEIRLARARGQQSPRFPNR